MTPPQVVKTKDAKRGQMGQMYLASGKQVALRRWEEDPGELSKGRGRAYETVGYLLEGKLRLDIAGEDITLEAGDSWVVPAMAEHAYQILESIVAIEATSPPARSHGEDDKPQ